jgi:hypothetical protein
VLTPKAVIEVLAADARNRRRRDAGHDGQPLSPVRQNSASGLTPCTDLPYSWMTLASFQFFVNSSYAFLKDREI